MNWLSPLASPSRAANRVTSILAWLWEPTPNLRKPSSARKGAPTRYSLFPAGVGPRWTRESDRQPSEGPAPKLRAAVASGRSRICGRDAGNKARLSGPIDLVMVPQPSSAPPSAYRRLVRNTGRSGASRAAAAWGAVQPSYILSSILSRTRARAIACVEPFPARIDPLGCPFSLGRQPDFVPLPLHDRLTSAILGLSPSWHPSRPMC